MKTTILCVGKIKESYLKEAVCEYAKRLSLYTKLEIIEVPDEKTAEKMSAVEIAAVKNKEAVQLEKYLHNNQAQAYKIALAIEGKQFSSEALASFFEHTKTAGKSSFIFVIGGSLGLADCVLKQCDLLLSFSKMTFPHQLMRVLVLEQLYRCFRISSGEPYHK